ncbi:SAV_2336 N-terminal domain-related protein [Streptomyces edwardsiae]|uniref:SAV_2336 N-terminal domain-related protein n=1 Tax=Streptomyces edwardsiae TaxID=3075527 RepID=A0ABU2QG67_9ACTN|nr:SAV_2336 N-terminal domain-related protein [Streptomyces sp. DSM 41635]MDT0402874.1 SAV_2336 N-terminal domain-related protein [Streptomyces sp. DSM 41635]
MPSDRSPEGSGSPDALARLADVLAEAAGGPRPAPRELAELLWLARTMDREPGAGPHAPSPEPAAPARPAGPSPSVPPPPPPPASTPPASPSGSSRTPLRLPSPAPSRDMPGEPHAALLAPAPPMLRRPLALQRSLRPLKRRVDAPVGRELDERATADRIARLGAAPDWWLPVMRPARERWLRLNLVHDTGPTMPVWRPLIRELHTALAQSGIFRTVGTLSVGPDGTVRGPGAHAPSDGRCVTLVISDCMGRQWRPGPGGERWYGVLRRWAHRMPLAIVQPLPEHLWRDTALPTVPGRLSAPRPAAPSATLTFAPYDTPGTTVRPAPDETLPLPVLEPAPGWLANWARLIAAPGGTEVPAAVADLCPPFPEDVDGRTDLGRLPPEELVLRFRGSASPEAFRLAGHLALSRPDLPVMRLVQAATDPDPRPQHLAEVILSGMLTTVPGPPGSYTFRPGVRELLLRGLPRSARHDTSALLHRVGALIDDRAGRAPGDFRASVPARSGTGTAVGGEEIASVSADSARRLTGGDVAASPPGSEGPPQVVGGRYRLVRRITPTGTVWQAEDTEEGRTVVLRLHGRTTDPMWREAFRRDARLLAGLGHPNVVRVHAAGFDGDIPYVVMEHLDGVALNSLAAPNGYRLPAPLLVSVGAQLARALTALHAAGLTHGGLGLSRVVLLPDGTVRLSLFEPGRTSGPAGRSEDLRALCEMLLMLAWGTARLTVPLDPRNLGHLPQDLREKYARALELLMSPSAEAQTRGRDLLLDPELPRLAEATYEERRRYHALGPFRVELAGRFPALGPHERAMLAVLLLKHGRTVTHDDLRRGMWSAPDEPDNAMAVLGVTASRLRDALGPGVLATLSHGFALHTSADHVDVVHCEDLVRRADEARRRDDLAGAHALITEALGLWRGDDPLADVPGPAARTARTRLVQLRLNLHRQRAELALDLGDPARAAADLEALVRAHPSREDFRRLHLIALRRQGRAEEALAVYEEYELAGGRHPELLALGHELREELDGPARDDPASGTPPDEPEYDPLAAPDELPEGTYPAWDPTTSSPSDPLGDRPAYVSRPPGIPPEARPSASEDDGSATPAGQDPVDPSDALTGFFFDVADGPEHPDTVAALGRAVTRVLTAAGMPAEAYRFLERDEGCTVLMQPGGPTAPLLRAALRGFPDMLRVVGGPRLIVTVLRMWDEGRAELPAEAAVRAALDSSGAHGVFALAPSLRQELATERERTESVRPLDGERTVGWYTAFPRDTAPLPPVLGPFPLPAGHLPPSQGSTRTVVYALPGGGLGTSRVPGADRYYEVDLTEHRTALELRGPELRHGSVAVVRGEAVWRVSDPVALAGGGPHDVRGFLRRHVATRLRETADRLPSAGRAQLRHALLERLGTHGVPHCTVRWDLLVSALPAARASHIARHPEIGPADVLMAADTVIVGFDTTLTRLFHYSRAAEVVRDLARLAVEGRDPEDALSGRRPLAPEGRPVTPAGDGITPVELLRALTGHPMVEEVRAALDRHETRAARTARPEPLAIDLVRALSARRLRLAVVTDHAAGAAEAFLNRVGLTPYLAGGVHGRSADLARLMPHPDVLHRALDGLGAAPARCVMIGSTAVESAAAGAAGVPFIGCRHADGVLRRSGPASLTVEGLRPLLDAVRALPQRGDS